MLKSLQRYSESEEVLKQAFKLDPNDRELELILQNVMILNRSQVYKKEEQLPELCIRDPLAPPKHEKQYEFV